MQLASSQLVKRIEEQQIDLHWYESTVLIKVRDEIRVATLFHAKEVNEYSISAIDGSLIDSGRTDSIDTALQRLSDCSFGAKILIDTLSVRINSRETKAKELCLPTDHELFRATRADWLMLLPEEGAAQKLRGQWEEDCDRFTCELVKLNVFWASVWLRAADDVIQEATINSWLSPALFNRFIYVSIRNSRHGREGIKYRTLSVAGALEVMSNLLGGRELLIDTLVLKSNTPFEKHFTDRIVPCDECLYEFARRFFLHAASADCSLPAEGLDPEHVRRCVMGDSLTSVLLSENVRAWNTHSEEDKSFACFDEKSFVKCQLNGLKIKRTDFLRCDFSSAELQRLSVSKSNLSGTKFCGANLSGCRLTEVTAADTDFTDAILTNAKFTKCNLQGAVLRNADVSGADFKGSNLRGLDLTVCNISKANGFAKAQYDEHTKLPADFDKLEELVWKGEGADPYQLILMKKQLVDNPSSLDFSSFVELVTRTDTTKVEKALNMLKQESFQLFCEQNDSGVLGVIKSQTDPDLVYACKLGVEGTFACCTQNLNPCGGLRGSPCKHIYVLVIGLAKAGEIDASDVVQRLTASKRQKPALNKDVMTTVFLRYQGAESGEIDWRPTETIPEDYYVF